MSNAGRDYWFQAALVEGIIRPGVYVSLDEAAKIATLECNVDRSAKMNATRVEAVALPGMINVHCHAFQRAFAGLTEYSTSEQDNFWTWRNQMYGWVKRLTPEQMYETARELYAEFWASGYSWVGEFHYVHHQADGTPYDDRAAMASALVQAAQDVGLGICLLPVLYQRSGFDNNTPEFQQRPFVLDEDAYLALLDACHERWKGESRVTIGAAIHSLRAVQPEVIKRVLDSVTARRPDTPIHIHVAEQIAEVHDCLASTGRRPIEFLFDEFDVNEQWCLVHATHITPSEISKIAESKAVVGLCPTTEANLGDGIFPAREFLQQGGRIALGSDSNLAVSPFSEIRMLEYGQRLSNQLRVVLSGTDQPVASRIYAEALMHGSAALGIDAGELVVGRNFDAITILAPRDHLEMALESITFRETVQPMPFGRLSLSSNA